MDVEAINRTAWELVEKHTNEKESIKAQAASQSLDSPSRTMWQHRVTRQVGIIEGVQILHNALMKEANVEPPI